MQQIERSWMGGWVLVWLVAVRVCAQTRSKSPDQSENSPAQNSLVAVRLCVRGCVMCALLSAHVSEARMCAPIPGGYSPINGGGGGAK